MNLREAEKVLDAIKCRRMLPSFDRYKELRKKKRFTREERMELRRIHDDYDTATRIYEEIAFNAGIIKDNKYWSFWEIIVPRCEADRVIATGCSRYGCHEDTGIKVRSLMCIPPAICGGCRPLCKKHRSW